MLVRATAPFAFVPIGILAEYLNYLIAYRISKIALVFSNNYHAGTSSTLFARLRLRLLCELTPLFLDGSPFVNKRVYCSKNVPI